MLKSSSQILWISVGLPTSLWSLQIVDIRLNEMTADPSSLPSIELRHSSLMFDSCIIFRYRPFESWQLEPPKAAVWKVYADFFFQWYAHNLEPVSFIVWDNLSSLITALKCLKEVDTLATGQCSPPFKKKIKKKLHLLSRSINLVSGAPIFRLNLIGYVEFENSFHFILS